MNTRSVDVLIAIAGPFSAPTEAQRKHNLSALNKAALDVLRLGHIPVIGVNAALPVVEQPAHEGDEREKYDQMMEISLSLIAHCDALLMVGESPGANRERDYMRKRNRPVYYSIEEIPAGRAALE